MGLGTRSAPVSCTLSFTRRVHPPDMSCGQEARLALRSRCSTRVQFHEGNALPRVQGYSEDTKDDFKQMKVSRNERHEGASIPRYTSSIPIATPLRLTPSG